MLAPMVASQREAVATFVAEETDSPNIQRTWRVRPLAPDDPASGEALDPSGLHRFIDPLSAYLPQSDRTLEHMHLYAPASLATPQVIRWIDVLVAQGWTRVSFATRSGAATTTTGPLPACPKNRPTPSSAPAPADPVGERCEWCDRLGGRDTAESSVCLQPMVSLRADGLHLYTREVTIEQALCTNAYAAASEPPTLMLLAAQTCPSIPATHEDVAQETIALLERIERARTDRPLCPHAIFHATEEVAWGEALAIYAAVGEALTVEQTTWVTEAPQASCAQGYAVE